MAADPLTSKTVGDLLNYDVSDDDDPFADIALQNTRDDKTTLSPRAAKRKADDDQENFGLGLDEEVKITKKRKPVAKLDEARLLSQLGIPKLRAIAGNGGLAKKLRLKGKGHEFTDAARLLNYYQLWLDDLYPRAKFADGLQLVEKVGHSKRMQSLRREWIDEGKPGYLREREARKARAKEDAMMDNLDGDASTDAAPRNEIAAQGTEKQSKSKDHTSIFGNGLDSDDEGMFFPDLNTNKTGNNQDVPNDEDDLDALLAEQESRVPPKSTKTAPEPESEGEDDLDALLAEQESRKIQATSPKPSAKTKGLFEDDSDNDDDDLGALLAEQDARHAERGASKEPSKQQDAEYEPDEAMLSSSPIPNDAEDDLDALLAQQHTQREAREAVDPANNIQEAVNDSADQFDAEKEPEDSMPFSSPIPNEEIDDKELDTLLAELPE